MSYLTLGLTAPHYQEFDFPDEAKNEFVVSRRFRAAKLKVFSRKQIEKRSFLIKYKNFMNSPRSHFVYEMVCFVMIYLFDVR